MSSLSGYDGVARNQLKGPASFAFDAAGNLFTAGNDGAIVKFEMESGWPQKERVASTGDPAKVLLLLCFLKLGLS